METYETHQPNNYPLKPSDDEKLMAFLIYATSFFALIIGPLIIWLLKRDDSKFVDTTGKNYLNFILSYTIWSIIGTILLFVLIGFIILPIITILGFVFQIVGMIKAYQGEDYLPPLSIPFFK
ncbi:DUF4870 domain-containing protein [Staphylococcus muscae]|uniref:Membrane protein n=1 Tax=Staphylococcus muscae TaxID=1294 RepID=A0A240CA80_9STAP|nr:DUF4870 domain-containing protein [Staphylococcus muscae]AVQ33683.1 DUF4870 domain-containing protein [Staphylococcus muscae]PNZ02615.1 DUF4870 domain-containing protein [Staphylococcus muscae]GGA86823.1 membrane protein [Staphylococcus muscae]SNW03978.1 Uncharacterized protein conserved in bacteria [Staphylococcus muscae]